MDSYLIIGIKFTLGMIVAILQFNLLGRYEFSTNTPLNQIQNYILGGIIGGVIYNKSISILQFLIVLLIWALVVIVVKILILHTKTFRHVIGGKPIVLIKNGVVDVRACAALGVTADQISTNLRAEGISSVNHVKSAIMEANGKLTILDKNAKNPKFPIISNGQINQDVLDIISRDEEWLREEIILAGYHDPSDIFLGEYVDGHLFFVPYPK